MKNSVAAVTRAITPRVTGEQSSHHLRGVVASRSIVGKANGVKQATSSSSQREICHGEIAECSKSKKADF
jgi:hypothetical protein